MHGLVQPGIESAAEVCVSPEFAATRGRVPRGWCGEKGVMDIHERMMLRVVRGDMGCAWPIGRRRELTVVALTDLQPERLNRRTAKADAAH